MLVAGRWGTSRLRGSGRPHGGFSATRCAATPLMSVVHAILIL
ncbi:hypothetical protein I546_5657 [Mycobacterium kansasii 732]|nr:hypothetical protein I546_5657 [Mycobacterium kansasii 732]